MHRWGEETGERKARLTMNAHHPADVKQGLGGHFSDGDDCS